MKRIREQRQEIYDTAQARYVKKEAELVGSLEVADASIKSVTRLQAAYQKLLAFMNQSYDQAVLSRAA